MVRIMRPITYAFVFARGGSRGVPGKNIRLLGGKPLIAHSIDIALQSQDIDRVIVSTDSEDIAEVARQYGAEVPFMRPAELAGDDTPEHNAWQHAVREIHKNKDFSKMGIFVSLPATAPFRLLKDVDTCIEKFKEGNADTVIAVSEADSHPWFNMVSMNEADEVNVIVRPDHIITRRQDAPKVYDITTAVYVTTPEFIMRSSSYFDGVVKAVEIPRERALDIDTELDFEFAMFLQKKNALS